MSLSSSQPAFSPGILKDHKIASVRPDPEVAAWAAIGSTDLPAQSKHFLAGGHAGTAWARLARSCHPGHAEGCEAPSGYNTSDFRKIRL